MPPEERGEYVDNILNDTSSRTILCSIQYVEEVRKTLQYVEQNNFDMFIQWLNPGAKDEGSSFDHFGILNWLLGHEAIVSIRDGQFPPIERVEELREFVHGWASRRDLTFDC